MSKVLLLVWFALCLVLILLALDPQVDLDAAHLFFVGPDHFIGDTRAGIVVRYVAWTLPFATYAALLIAALARRFGLVPPGFAPTGRSLVFLTATLVLGPGLIVHATLKEFSHRPRPYSIAAFGGRAEFRPFTRFDGTCRHNCSFPSGETAAATWMLAPASLVPPPWRAGALAGALAFAAATGALRMAFGAHFLSDVCGAALITILIVFAARRLLMPREG